MKKHWYIIADKNDDQWKTYDRREAKQAVADGCIVTEIKEQEIYMENGLVRVIIHLELR